MVKLFLLAFTLCLAFSIPEVKAQISNGRVTPVSFSLPYMKQDNSIPLITLPALDRKQAEIEDAQWIADGYIPRIGRIIPVNIDPQQTGLWENLRNGDRVWRMRIVAEEAQAISLYFGKYHIPHGAQIHVYSTDKKHIIGGFGAENNQESGLMATEYVYGSDIIIEYYEPYSVKGQGRFFIEEIGYGYKDITNFGSSQSCQVNVNCSEGNGLENQRNAVARILVRTASSQGWCTGTLVNNVRQNCTPYFLTAMHCGLSGTSLTSESNINQWIFYFNFQSSSCANPSTSPSTAQTITGAAVRAHSNDGGGNTGSDMLLLELNATPPANYNAYYAGWNVNNTATTGGFGIHHPAGDIKKISKFTGTTASTSWRGNTANTHWSVSWVATANGHGTTEGGSSGSALFNNNGLIIGSLTGGGASCTNRTSPDAYGKMSYHWTGNGNSAAYRLKDWLDPDNTGTTILNGIAAPCTQHSLDASIAEIINPQAGLLTCENPIAPQVVLKNNGTTTLTSVGISTVLNNSLMHTYNWTGSLASGASTTVTLPAVSLTPFVTSTFRISTFSPNGGVDGNRNNDLLEATTLFESTVVLPYRENFNAGTIPSNIYINNPDGDPFQWQYVANASSDGTGGAIKFDNFNSVGNSNPRGTNDYFFLPDLSFANHPNPILTYDIAHRPYSTTSNDSLLILVSIDCGRTYQIVYAQGGADLASVAGVETNDFIPNSSQWANRTLNLSAFANQERVSIAFMNKSNWGNNIYIDNININRACNISANQVLYSGIACYGGNNGIVEIAGHNGTAPYTYKWNNNNEQTSGRFNNLSAGTYTFTVTDAVGCTVTRQVVFNNPTPPVVTPTVTDATCLTPSNGMVRIGITGTSGAVSYNIGNGAQSSNTFMGLAAGNYIVTVTYGSACSVTAPFTITTPANPMQAIATTTNVACYNTNTGAIAINVLNGGGTYTYNRGTGNQTNNTFTNLSAGNYTITVTSSQGCVATTTATIEQPREPMTVTANVTNVNCRNTNTGSIVLNVMNASGGNPMTYNIGNGGRYSNVFDNLPAGTYNVSVSSAAGCIATTTAVITEPATAVQASIAKTDVLCRNTNTGSMVVTASNGTAPYTYNIGQGIQTNNTFTNLAAGRYTVTVTSADGCTATASTTIDQPANFVQATIAKNDVLCKNTNTGSIIVTVRNGTGPYTYNIGQGVQYSNVFLDLAAGAYTVTVTTTNGCVATASTTITEPATAVQASISKTDVSCTNANTGRIIVTASNGIAPYTYNIGRGGETSNTFRNLAAGTYTVTVTSGDGCKTTVSTTITEPATAVQASISKTDVLCSNSNTGSLVVTASNGTAPYTYNRGTGNQTNNTFTNLAAGAYTVTVTSADGCTATASTTIEQPANALTANIDTLVQPSVGCISQNNGLFTVNTSGGTAPYTYNIGQGAQTANSFGNLGGGVYVVTITDANGCSTTTTATLNSQISVINATVQQGAVLACANSTTTLTVTANGGNTPYTYNIGAGNQTNNIFNNVIAGNYTITVTDALGCQNTVNTIVVAPLAMQVNNVKTDITCYGQSTGSIRVNVDNGITPYTYNIGQGPQSSNAFYSLAAGNYTITVTDANGCTSTTSQTITSPATELVSTVNILSHEICYRDNNGSFTLNTTGGVMPYTYSINIYGNYITQSSPIFTNLPGDTYQVTVRDSIGCTIIVPVTIQAGVEHRSTSRITPMSCAGNDGAINLTIVSGALPYTYAWSTGDTTSHIEQLSAGIYTLTLTDNNGCSYVSGYEIINDCNFGNCIITFMPSITQNDCFNDCNGVISVAIANGLFPLAYTWSNGDTTATIRDLCPGLYTLTVVAGDGCTETETYTITAPSELNVDVQISQDKYTATALPTGGTAPYTYLWSNGDTTATITDVNQVDFYSVIVTDANGCTMQTAAVELYPVSVEILSDKVAFEVFPNPNEGDFTIKVEYLSARAFDLTIVDVLGRNLSQYHFHEASVDLPMNMTQYASGVYFIQLQSEDRVQIKKVIITR